MLPKGLVGQTHLGSYICSEWELRVTGRCLEDDLEQPSESDFDEFSGIEIVKALVKDRFDRTHDTRQVSPLTCGKPIWVLSRGNDHRGGTWFDARNRVVWLVAAGRHRSGAPGDFYPYCKQLDADGVLLPTDDDYERLFRDRDRRFAHSIRIEGPLILKQARAAPGEHRVMLGGTHGICIAIEYAEELEAITVAFRLDTLEFDYVPIVLQAIQVGKWDPVGAMPSRALESVEYAFELIHEPH